MTKQEQYAADLRYIADFIEAHPKLRVPSPNSFAFHGAPLSEALALADSRQPAMHDPCAYFTKTLPSGCTIRFWYTAKDIGANKQVGVKEEPVYEFVLAEVEP